MKLKRMLIYASAGYLRMRNTRRREAFNEVTIKLLTVCNKLMEKDETLFSGQRTLIQVAGHDFSFRETCGIEKLPALMLRDRLPLEMVMTMFEKNLEEIDLTEFDILWSEEPFAVTWGEGSECITPAAREALEKYLRTFEIPGTWECQMEEDPNISIWHGKCMFLVNRAKILGWGEGDLLYMRAKS